MEGSSAERDKLGFSGGAWAEGSVLVCAKGGGGVGVFAGSAGNLRAGFDGCKGAVRRRGSAEDPLTRGGGHVTPDDLFNK